MMDILAESLTVTNVSVSIAASVLVAAVWFYVLSPLYTRSVIRAAFKEVDGQKLGETKFVPIFGEFAAVGAAKFTKGIPVAHAARCTMENFEHGVVRDTLGRGKFALAQGNLAYLPVVTSKCRDVNHDVLIKQSHSFGKPDFVRAALQPVIGSNNLVLLDGDAHASRRRLLSPAFSISNLKHLIPMFARAARLHVSRVVDETRAHIAGHGGNGTHHREVLPWISRLTLDVIGTAAFGGFEAASAASGSAVSPAVRVANAIDGLAEEHNADLTRNPLYVLLPRGWWSMVPTAKNVSKAARFKELCRVADAIITSRQAHIASLGADEPPPHDVLQLMIDARDASEGGARAARRMDAASIRDEGLLLIFAGHETTAVLLTWSLFLLTQFPEWMQAVRDEADAARARGGTPFLAPGAPDAPAPDDPLKALPVAYGVLREALRLYPPVALYSRMATCDLRVGKEGRLFLPKGTTVNIAAGVIHRDPAIWPDPEAFDPCRWMSDEQVAALGRTRMTVEQAADWTARRLRGEPPSAAEETAAAHPRYVPSASDMAFLPFAAGATGCIGSLFAQFEAICVLPAIVSALDVTLAGDYVHAPVSLMTTRPREGLALEMKPREGVEPLVA